ncbi:hypothetical protein TL16_g03543 [Triparma laevis f. inornata]|uniref:Phosphatidate cytidylyltransferase n=1 Tax=Triparma laevis f. inornata TaxID=1714386 RepID=A0A9W7A4X6_9STRA|nr:hypothetical protein TL16_g03543 [Triparma laevis f. inornata]
MSTSQRLTTAAVLIPIVFYLLSTPLSPLLLALLAFVNLKEMFTLDPFKIGAPQAVVAAAVGATLPYIFTTAPPSTSAPFSFILPLLSTYLFLLHRSSTPHLTATLCDLQVLHGYYSMNIIMQDLGMTTGVFLCLNCWGVDTAGLIVGKLLNKSTINKTLSSKPPFNILKRISPNKTPLGFIACLFAGPLCTLICRCIPYASPYSSSPVSQSELLTAIGLSICCVIGDLIQSWQKRKANVKDTGTVIKGHGGVWDRMDSMILAASFLVLVPK